MPVSPPCERRTTVTATLLLAGDLAPSGAAPGLPVVCGLSTSCGKRLQGTVTAGLLGWGQWDRKGLAQESPGWAAVADCGVREGGTLGP